MSDHAVRELAIVTRELLALRQEHDRLRAIYARESGEHIAEMELLRESNRDLADERNEWAEKAERAANLLRRERDAYSRSLERAEAVLDFWEAEARRARDGGTGDPNHRYHRNGQRIPDIVWWHAHRRAR